MPRIASGPRRWRNEVGQQERTTRFEERGQHALGTVERNVAAPWKPIEDGSRQHAVPGPQLDRRERLILPGRDEIRQDRDLVIPCRDRNPGQRPKRLGVGVGPSGDRLGGSSPGPITQRLSYAHSASWLSPGYHRSACRTSAGYGCG